MSKFIYKILTHSEWADFRNSGSCEGTAADLRDGYIHLSDSLQLVGTIERHYTSEAQVMVLELEEEDLSAHLRWERSRRGDLYPHLYRPLRLEDVRRVEVLAVADTARPDAANPPALGTIPQALLPRAT